MIEGYAHSLADAHAQLQEQYLHHEAAQAQIQDYWFAIKKLKKLVAPVEGAQAAALKKLATTSEEETRIKAHSHQKAANVGSSAEGSPPNICHRSEGDHSCFGITPTQEHAHIYRPLGERTLGRFFWVFVYRSCKNERP